MDRITIKHLEPVVERINKAAKQPLTSYTKNGAEYMPNIGNYHLSGAYGGWCLHQMVTIEGGVHDVFTCGHIPARDLYNRMHAFLTGLEIENNL